MRGSVQRRWRTVLALPACAAVVLVPSAARGAGVDAGRGWPSTRVDPVKEVLHGVEVPDPYRWLEDQQSPETRAWIDAQNTYTHSLVGSWPGGDALRKRLSELIKIDTANVPYERKGRYFFSKRLADQDLFVLYVRRGASGQDDVLVDPHPLSPDHTTSVTLLDVSVDGTQIVYGVRQGGEDEVAPRILDVDTRRELTDTLPKGRYQGISLTADTKGIYYSRLEKEGPRVFFHTVGGDPTKDVRVFGDGYGPEKIIGAGLSEDGRYLVMTVYHGSAATKTEVYVQDVVAKGPVVTVVNDLDARFQPDVAGDRLYLKTNWEAPNGRVLQVDLKAPGRDRWREVVPTGKGVIDGISLAGGKLFVNDLVDVKSRVRVFDAEGHSKGEIAFPSLGTVSGISGSWGGGEAFFAFSSFHLPTTIYRYDVATGTQSVWAKQAVPIDSERFEVKQEWYASKDGTRVPMFLVHRKGLKLDGSSPALLTGYGGFTATMTPVFSSRAALWVERGGVFALPNLRGGGEFGEEWHKAGMLDHKQNVFDDFIAAAEWLIANKYTSAARLAITGGSNGGLLVGAALTQVPDLFGAVVCSYPLLDMVRYHKFLVAGYWVPEYGSSEDAAQFKYLLAYSPYHRVKPGTKYPAVLFITGDGDTRVAPLHARKMTALLQSATASAKPVLLQYDTKAGHSGGKPISKTIEDLADELSFLFHELGVGAAVQ
jgi:prolyl oligopeptidase